MAERHPGWVNNITAFEARQATGLLVAAHGVGDAVGPLRVRTGIRDAPGFPGQATLATNKVTVRAFQAVIADPGQPGDGAYLVTMDAAKELALNPSSDNAWRLDLVVAEVIDAEPGFQVTVYIGTNSATDPPPRPAVSNQRSLVLAEIKVPPTGSGSPFLTDTRRFTAALNGIIPVRNEADRPANPHGSMILLRLDTGVIEVRKNEAWVPYRPPRGSVDSWHAPSLLNNWANYGGGYPPASYTITEDGWVRLRGLIKSGVIEPSLSKPAFQLPSGYRPVAHQLFPVGSGTTGWDLRIGRVDIDTNGNVCVTIGNNSWVSLEGISFATY